MGQITVFLDKTGRPIGSCAAGNESDWINNFNKNRREEVLSLIQVSSTDEEWHEWAKSALTPYR